MKDECVLCNYPMDGHGYWDSCQTPEKKLERIKHMVSEQADDPGLWFSATTNGEKVLQISLRTLHALIDGASPDECVVIAIKQVLGK